MNKKHWDKFYKKGKAPLQPTEFAKFCLKYIKPKSILIDVGCGNGRDTLYFNKSKKFNYVVGIDESIESKAKSGLYFVGQSFTELDIFNCDYVYSRFFIHSIKTNDISIFLDKITFKGQILMSEFRVKGDEPKIYKDHKRNLVDSDWFLQLLIYNNFEILYFKKGRGMAKYKTEDPLVIRVIAKKK
ncbi:MAG: class I SAM-dependent methyltransferase [Bacteroidales bacterium]